ncbi:alpha-ketoacid dehydrogenase subunit beta [Candidatus Aerophobetes bacterium]|uniref:Alpha-ketoacid dehydrogenase subunit beta n=1 Tax=Aerophobetes bacterium TaxID=2030807 RepID=A0A662DAW9_UNCAE|nr:MAG: alpha-ketoacid dehydrogenase subunit beta [Candidatus Aerophobetes bacterium]
MAYIELTYREALRRALREELKRDEDVYLLGEDIGVYGGAFGVTQGLLEEFGPKRIKDTPLSEAAIIGVAIGSALTGMRPVAEIMFMDFITIGMDQLVNQAAKIHYMYGGKAKVPMVLRTPAGSGTGAAAQHSQSLEALLCHIPGLKVVMPSTAYDALGLLKSSIRDNNPVMFIEHKLLYSQKARVPEEEYLIPLGKADVKREGKDITVVALSVMVPRVLEVAEKIVREGIRVEVVDPRTLVPFDLECIVESVKKTHRLLIVHEACRRGGFGAEILSRVEESDAFDFLDTPIRILAGKDVPIPYSPNLEKAAVPQLEDIERAIREMLA